MLHIYIMPLELFANALAAGTLPNCLLPLDEIVPASDNVFHVGCLAQAPG